MTGQVGIQANIFVPCLVWIFLSSYPLPRNRLDKTGWVWGDWASIYYYFLFYFLLSLIGEHQYSLQLYNNSFWKNDDSFLLVSQKNIYIEIDFKQDGDHVLIPSSCSPFEVGPRRIEFNEFFVIPPTQTCFYFLTSSKNAINIKDHVTWHESPSSLLCVIF